MSTPSVTAGGGHPFLLQLLSKRAAEHGDVERTITAVAADRSISCLFEADLELLDDQQRSILSSLTESDGARVEGDSPALVELEQLGLVERDDAGMVWFALPLFAFMRRRSRSGHQVRPDV